VTRSFVVILSATLLATPAIAQPAADTVTARLRFQEGLEQAANGDLHAAIRAFEAAYAAQPHFSVLYNIARAQSALGQSVEASHNFQRYLTEGGSQVGEARRREIQLLLESNQRRIGTLEISVAAPEVTRVWLDGAELSPDRLGHPFPVTAGKHALLYSGGASYPIAEEITVPAMTRTEVRIPVPTAPSRALAQLAIACDVPGVDVVIDGDKVAITPIEWPLMVESGVKEVRFGRPGYRATKRVIPLEPRALATAACDVRPEANLGLDEQAALRIWTEPPGAHVRIDGRPYGGTKLPFGPHAIEVEYPGYLPYRKTISLAAGTTGSFDIVLQPTPAKKAREAVARSRRKTLAVLLAGAGTSLLVSGGSLFLWNQRRYDDWKAQQHGVLDVKRVASIQRVDDLALGLAIVGASVDAAALWLLLTKPTN
jgi:hypothetical protein